MKKNLVIILVAVLSLGANGLAQIKTEQKSALSEDRDLYLRYFQSAADEFGVPVDIIKGVSFSETRWSHLVWAPGDSVSECSGMPRAYGIMGLWDNAIFGHSLRDAATLIQKTPQELKESPLQNIRGAAALLKKYYITIHKNSNANVDSLENWFEAIAQFSGIPENDLAEQFSLKTFQFLSEGYQLYGIKLPKRAINLEQMREKVMIDRGQEMTMMKNTHVERITSTPDYPSAIWRPSKAGYYYTSGISHNFIVIHDMEGTYEATVYYFQTLSDGTQKSIHYCVNGKPDLSSSPYSNAPAGEITQMVEEKYWAWHALCWNKYMFGIEHEGYANKNPAWFTTEMYNASSQLVKYLCDKYAIPKDRNHIIGHNQWQTSSWVNWVNSTGQGFIPTCNTHTDPGPNWDWTGFMNLVIGTPPQATATITNISVSPAVTNQGSTIMLTYTIEATGNMSVLLGASIKISSSSTWDVSDQNNDVSVSLVSGTQQKTRSFYIPFPLASGTYDLLVALWSDNNGNNRIDGLIDTRLYQMQKNSAFTIGTTPTQYVVNLSSNPVNGGTTSGGGTYNSGSSVTVTATPSSGYTFSNWTESGTQVSTSSSYTFTISGNRTLVANFTVIPPTQYSVSLSSNPANGGTTSGGGTYNSGSSVTVTATPSSGYTFSNWTESGTQVSTSSSYTFTVNNSRTLVANFTVIPPTQYSVSLLSNPPNGGATNGNGIYNSGSRVTVTATPNSGYTFSNWTENGTQVSTSSSYIFTISSNRTLVANFTAIPPTQYSVSLSSNPVNGGTTSGGGTYNSGSSVTVTATPSSGYTFSNWTESGTQVSTSPSYTFTISGSRTLVANFSISATPIITVSTHSLPDFGSIIVGQNSSAQPYTVTGSNLTSNITIQAPTGFQIGLSSSSTFTNTLTLTQSGGIVQTTPIYARFSPLSTSSQSGNISLTSNGATPENVSVSGTGINSPSCNYTLSSTGVSIYSPSQSNGFWVYTTSSCSWTAITGGCSGMITLTNATGTGNGMVTFDVSANASASPRSCTITVGAQTFTVTQAGYVAPCSSAPIAPNNLTVDVIDSNVLYLSWDGNNINVTDFEIERGLSATGPFVVIGSSGNSFGYRDANVVGGTTYYYRVKACCNSNCSNYTNVASKQACTFSASATGISATADTIFEGDNVTLTVHGGTLGTGATWTWRTTQCNSGQLVGTGTSITVSPNSTTNYVVKPEGGNCVTSITCVNKSITVKPLPPTQYSVSLLSNPPDGGTTNGNGIYNSGSSVTVIATPNSGYTFTNWTEGGTQVSVSSSYIFTISSNRTLVANFTAIAPTQYSVSLSSNPVSGGTTSGGGAYNSGSSVTVSATPNSGYVFNNWIENGTQISTSSSYTFTISGNRTLVANFTVIPPTQYSVSLLSNPPNGGTTNGNGIYNSGSSVTVTATTNSGFTFTNWTENGTQVSTSSSYTFTISSNRTLVANFTAIQPTQYSVSLSSNPVNAGTTSGGGTYNSGSSVTVTATPSSGYTFINWTENGTEVSTRSSYTFTMPANDRNLVANFSFGFSITITTDPTGRQIVVDGMTYTSPQTFTTWIVGSQHSIGVTSPQSETAGTEYIFSSWSDQGSQSHNITVSQATTTYTAIFVTKYYLTMSSGPGGTVTQNSGWFNSGQNVQLDATPNEGYLFSSWSGTGNGSYTGTTKFTRIFMNSPITEKANFTIIPKASLIPVVPTGLIKEGTEFWVDVKVGEPMAVIDLYKISFRLSCDNSNCFYVEGSAIKEDFLGTSPLFSAKLIDRQTAEISIIKTTASGTSGSGMIAKAKFISTNISSKQKVVFSLSNITATNSLENKIQMIPSTDTVTIITLEKASLKLVGPSSVKNNTNFTISVVVGDPNPVFDLNRISFKIKSDNATCSFIENTAHQGQFFGENVSEFFKIIDNQTVDAALTKSTIPGVSGSGTIAMFDYKSLIDQFVTFSLSNVNALDSNGSIIPLNVIQTGVLVDVQKTDDVPHEYSLSQNFPNPFNPSTRIKFDIPQQTKVKLSIYDIFGREVDVLADKNMASGTYEIIFDGSKLTSGIYFYRLQTGGFVETKKLILMK